QLYCATLYLTLPTTFIPPVLLFHHTPPPHPYTLSLHDALRSPGIGQTCASGDRFCAAGLGCRESDNTCQAGPGMGEACLNNPPRSEEHTSELQSHLNLVCRLLLEKKKQKNTKHNKELTSKI